MLFNRFCICGCVWWLDQCLCPLLCMGINFLLVWSCLYVFVFVFAIHFFLCGYVCVCPCVFWCFYSMVLFICYTGVSLFFFCRVSGFVMCTLRFFFNVYVFFCVCFLFVCRFFFFACFVIVFHPFLGILFFVCFLYLFLFHFGITFSDKKFLSRISKILFPHFCPIGWACRGVRTHPQRVFCIWH